MKNFLSIELILYLIKGISVSSNFSKFGKIFKLLNFVEIKFLLFEENNNFS